MSRDEIDPSMLRPRKKRAAKTPAEKKAAEEAQTEVTEKANEELAKVSSVLDPQNPAVIVVTLPDGAELSVDIFKCKARQIGYVMRFLANAFKAIGIENFDGAAEVASGMTNPINLLGVIAEVMDDAIVIATMLTSISEETFHELELDDALAIMLAVWTVNQAFFSARVLPLIMQIMARGKPEQTSSPEKTPSATETST